MNLSKPTGFATPFMGDQAPDHLTLGYSTQLELEGETKYFPLEKVVKARKARPSAFLDPLPTFPLGVVPTFTHQQNSDLRQRGFDGPKINYDGSRISADLADAFAQLADSGRRVAAPLSDAFVGSQWDYGPREGRPFGTTDGNNFVLAYHGALRESELDRRAAKLIKEGYDAKRVMRVMEEEVDNTIREKLKHR
jgi:hypothetical protein